MKMIPVFAVLFTSTVAMAGQPTTPAGPVLQPQSECLVPDEVKNWGVVDDRRLVVETLGPRYYDIKLTSDCSELQARSNISFRNGSSFNFAGAAPALTGTMGADDGRICGDINDAVVAHGSEPATGKACDIAQIRRIDAGTFDAVFGKSAEEGNALLDGVERAESPLALAD
jgi:hypothetical protein